MLTLVISVLTNVFVITPIIVCADPGDQPDSYYNATTLNVTVLALEPRINWYDLQNATGVSMLNAQLDVDQPYSLIVNISSDQGWADVDYVNITGWHDLGTDPSSYNNTLGGNINFWIQYENTTGTANWNLIWPSGELTLNVGSCTDVNSTDPLGSPGNTECHNLTFVFTPGYQFRYAPDPATATYGFNDAWSWNFNITVHDDAAYLAYNTSEFGVYSYTSIVSAGWPEITGNPGDTPAYNDSYITIETMSNGNYSLGVNVTNLTHEANPTYSIQNTSILTAGGNLNPLSAFVAGEQHAAALAKSDFPVPSVVNDRY